MPSQDPTVHVSKRCGAKLTGGGTCKKWALRGHHRCKQHGGGTPASKAAIKRNLALGKARKAVVTYGLPQDIDPTDAFLEELARTNGHIKFLQEQIAELDNSDLIWGMIEQSENAGMVPEQNYSTEKVGAVAHLWLQLYFKERQHLIKVADLMIKNGLAEMQMQLNMRMAEVFEAAMIGMLTDLRIDPSRPEVRTVIAGRLAAASTAIATPIPVGHK